MRKNVTDSMGEEPGIKLPTSVRAQKRLENSRKTSTSASLTMLKRLTVQKTQKNWKLTQKTGNCLNGGNTSPP